MMKKENRNQNPANGNRSILCLLLIGIILLTFLTVPVTAAKLATPTLVYPPNNFHTYDVNGMVYYAWKPVPGATYYWREVQKNIGGNWVPFEQWYADPYSFSLYPTSSGEYTHTLRWRLYANNSNPAETSNPTAWRTLLIGIDQKKLATPILVGPPSGINFYHLPRNFIMDWKPVQGANRYKIEVQYYDPSLDTWVYASGSPAYNGMVHLTARGGIIPGPYKGRWRVEAQDTTGAWLNSTPTTWRTFTFKN